LNRKQPTWYLALIALLTIGLDQFTKQLVVSTLRPGESWMPLDWLAPIVTVTHVHNTGAAFGIFPAGGQVFTVLGVIVTGAIIYYFHQLPPGEWLARSALGLQLGGAVGNLIDRFRQGYVTDFINFKFWPVFNVADSSIVVGVAILLIVILLEERQEARSRAEESALSPDIDGDIVGGLEPTDSTAP